ncbi:hypothetical protein VW29_06305 [Devosia limi DSM 17137]|uniref:EamA domain-containing membrane protein RarD n=1 Tax=Devosia limi DSM 17137 TaxID=1121477 RepID=A0A0F5LTH3_9HYPH|nr:DMT family transporter [Devosia limi]KKB85675.1 hypothetical protein VW29_06305 [Devosia limi DSM 17137]SHE43634.1 EamA domain-containing membrane protein RarD [Devosia limi DSM 17137]
MSAPSLARAAETASLKGMVLGVLAYSMFAFHDALVKGIIMVMPIAQIMFVRSLVIVLGCLLVGRGKLIADLAGSTNIAMMLMRAMLTLAAWAMFYSTGRDLQLAEMTTLYYVAPIITILLAVVFLKERLTMARAGAAAIGFFGVVVACNPGGIAIGLPALLVLLAALCWGVAMILLRTISKSERSLTQIFFLNLVHLSVMGLVSIWLWQPMGWRELGFIAAAGIIGGIGQFVLVEAARQVPASVLGTVEYSALFWSFLLGYLFWSEQPGLLVYIGAALVVAAGLVLAWSERRGRRVIGTVLPVVGGDLT